MNVSPRYLGFTPLSSDYRRGYCHDNCESEVVARGGKVVCGWVVWLHIAQPLIEAEFHAVVRRDGKLLDVTPRQDNDTSILFVPDKMRKARRVDHRSWDTWSNMKLWSDHLFEQARPIRIIDSSESRVQAS